MNHSTPLPTAGCVAPPLDPELVPILEMMLEALPAIGDDTIAQLRELSTHGVPGTDKVDLTAAGNVRVEESTIPGGENGLELALTVLSPMTGTGPWPLIYYIHGGGLIAGDRHLSLGTFVPYAADGSAVVASIEYRLAPENPDPAPVTDCYTGLCWCVENAERLGLDPEHIIITGTSAGGLLAAGTALLARDRGYPHVTHQVLSCPMLDDRMQTPSARMLDGGTIWDRNDNLYGWTALLGDRRGTDDVSPYAAPARAKDLSGLPRTYIDVGTVETFRDEIVDYAQRLSLAGVSVDLHLWGGGFHGFDVHPQPAISQAARATRDEYFRRALER